MGGVLLLNATYEPLRVITTRRAVVLILDEKAEVIEHKDGLFRSASTAMPVPAVIRLRYFVKIPYRARLPLNRKAVVARDGGVCQYGCGRRGDTIDHVVPRSRGGQHRWENVVASCRKCNGKKDDRLLSELGWELARKPFAPKGTYWLVVAMLPDGEVDPEWEPYLAVA